MALYLYYDVLVSPVAEVHVCLQLATRCTDNRLVLRLPKCIANSPSFHPFFKSLLTCSSDSKMANSQLFSFGSLFSFLALLLAVANAFPTAENLAKLARRSGEELSPEVLVRDLHALKAKIEARGASTEPVDGMSLGKVRCSDSN